MTFLAAGALAALLFLAVPLVLHLVRPRPRTWRTTTLAFFTALHRTTRETPWLRRLKRLLALLLSCLVVALLALALARPVLAPDIGAVRTVVVLVDRSASMGARDARGHTRVAAAADAVRARLSAVPAGTAVALVAHDVRAEILCPPTLDHGEVLRALAALEARPVAAVAAARAAAATLAGHLAAAATPARLWLVTDQPEAPLTLPPEVTAERLPVALAAPANAGITAADLRRRVLDPGQVDVFVEVTAVLPPGTTRTAELTLAIDGTTTALRSLTCTADAAGRCAPQRLSFPLDRPTGDLLTLRLAMADDALAADDTVALRLPAQERLRVALVGSNPDPFLTLVLAGLAQTGTISLETVAPAAWKPDLPAEVVVFAGWLPPTWTPRPAVVMDPPVGAAPIAAVAVPEGLPVASPRIGDGGHPVLYGIASPRVTALQTAVLPADGPVGPLWSSAVGPFLAAGELQGARLVVLAAAPQRSEHLALTSVWPLLIGNALLWTSQPERDRVAGRRAPTGTVLTIAGERITWQDGQVQPAFHHLVELSRTGAWTSDTGERGTAALLDAGATCLPAAPATTTTAATGLGWRGDLLPLLIAVLLALLAIEAVLNHRWGVQ